MSCRNLWDRKTEPARTLRKQLQPPQESLHQQERILGRGYEEVLASLRQCAGQHPVPVAAGGDAFGDVVAAWGTPEILGRLEAMRMLLMQADRRVSTLTAPAGCRLRCREMLKVSAALM